jgi:hypothetical protein
MRALLCHYGLRLEAEDDKALLASVRAHLVRRHPTIPPTDEQVREIVATRAYNLEYAELYANALDSEDEFGPEPY